MAIIKIQIRRDTLANWQAENPVLLLGEIGYITDVLSFVIGDGVQAFSGIYASNAYRFRPESWIFTNIYNPLDFSITTQIQAEQAARVSGDAINAAAIAGAVAVNNAQAVSIAALFTGLSTETTNRNSAINAEAVTRDAADVALNDLINAVLTNWAGTASIKGEILAYDSVNGLVLPLAPGANGTALFADSGDARGLVYREIQPGDVAGLVAALAAKEATITAGTSAQYFRGDKTWQTLNKAAVGLSNVPNVDATDPANISQSAAYRFVTDAEKTTWNAGGVSINKIIAISEL